MVVIIRALLISIVAGVGLNYHTLPGPPGGPLGTRNSREETLVNAAKGETTLIRLDVGPAWFAGSH